MREISREEHEVILNLFIMAFMNWYMPTNKYQYDVLSSESSFFSLMKRLKDTFPMDEICEDVYTPSGLERMNFIKEV